MSPRAEEPHCFTIVVPGLLLRMMNQTPFEGLHTAKSALPSASKSPRTETPNPDRVKLCGLPAALSAMLTEAARGPGSVALKVMSMWHEALASTVPPVDPVGQVEEPAKAKSPEFVPVMVMLVIERVVLPVLVSVTLCDAVVACSPRGLKLSVLLDRLTAGAAALKVAVTAAAAVIVTVQVLVPVHAPLHPVKPEPADGVAVRVTMVPLAKFAEHVDGQEIPAGALLTLPVPAPARLTVNGKTVLPEFRYAVSNAKSVQVLAQLVRLKVMVVMLAPV